MLILMCTVKRTVVRVRKEEVEGYNEGDTIEVMITGTHEYDEDQEYITASRRKIEIEKNWEKIEDSLNNKTVLEGTITKKVKGGYLAQALYYPGFLPNSLSDASDDEDIVGKKVKLIVKDIKLDNKKNKRITYSIKDIRIIEQNSDFSKLHIGDVVTAEVLEILDFGLSVAVESLKVSYTFLNFLGRDWIRLVTFIKLVKNYKLKLSY